MSQPIDPDDHPLRPEDEDSDLRYDERTTDQEPDELGEDESDA
ncbi:MAG: hypothetical protein ACTHKS_01930 [Gaiellaceae bacterium]